MLLQFINVTSFHLVQPLLHFSPNSVVNRVQIWTVGSHRCGEMKAGISHSRRLIVLQARCAGALSFWKTKNSPEISRVTYSSCSVSSTSWQYTCAVNLNPKIDEYQVRFPELGHARERH